MSRNVNTLEPETANHVYSNTQDPWDSKEQTCVMRDMYLGSDRAHNEAHDERLVSAHIVGECYNLLGSSETA